MDAVQCDERRAGFAAHTKETTLKPGVSIALHGGTETRRWCPGQGRSTKTQIMVQFWHNAHPGIMSLSHINMGSLTETEVRMVDRLQL
jgi:hypothetical protein